MNNWRFTYQHKVLCLLVCTVAVGFLVALPQAVQAQDRGVLDPSVVVQLANDEYISGTAQVMRNMGDEKAVRWDLAKAGTPLLQHVYDPNRAALRVLYWVVPVYSDDDLVGLIGVNPYSGAYAWRLDNVPADYPFPSPPGLETLKTAVERTSRAQPWSKYDPERLVFVLVDKHNYWLLPPQDGSIDDSFLLPVDDVPCGTLEDLEPAPVPVESRVENAEPTPGLSSQPGIVRLAITPPVSETASVLSAQN